MKKDSLQIICCPDCKKDLSLEPMDSKGENVIGGVLKCSHCGKDFLIEKEIPRFIEVKELIGKNKQMEKFYNFWSHFYNLFNMIILSFIGGEKRARLDYLQKLEISKNSKVLEVSVGSGRNVAFFMDDKFKVNFYGIDFSSGQLKKCVSFLNKKNFNVELFLGGAENLPFKDSVFDVVFHCGGINFFKDKKKAIEEMIRVAKPGTKIVIAEENKRGQELCEAMGLRAIGWGEKKRVKPPKEDIPSEIGDVKISEVWKGFGYCMEFRKPR